MNVIHFQIGKRIGRGRETIQIHTPGTFPSN